MSNDITPFDQRILDASKPYGEAMIAVATLIPSDALLNQALQIREKYAKTTTDQHDAYEQAVRTLFADNNIVLRKDLGEVSAMLGYLNIKGENPDFKPSMEAFYNRVLEASKAYRVEVVGGSGQSILPAKDKLRSAIVAGQFDTGDASVIIADATRFKKGSAGVGGRE